MTVKLDLAPQVEAELLCQARAEGLSLDQFVRRKLEAIAQAAAVAESGNAIAAEDWEAELEAWFDSFPQGTALPDSASQRDDWYPDRW